IAVIETGLGGRLDSTNVIMPICSIITSISMDHMNILGDTLAAIAGEKAGIIKMNVPVVTAGQDREVMDVIASCARARQSELFVLNERFSIDSVIKKNDGFVFDYRLSTRPAIRMDSVAIDNPVRV